MQIMLDRRAFIGSSDAAAVLGKSPFRTPLQVYMEKTSDDPVPHGVDTDDEHMFAGRVLENGIRKIALRKLDKRFPEDDITVLSTNERVSGDSDEWMSCELDTRLQIGERQYALEIKNSKAWDWGDEEWTQDIPEYIWVQALYQMATCPELEGVIVGCFLSGWKMKLYYVPRQRELIQSLVAELALFWKDHILAKIPPAPAAGEEKLIFPIAFKEQREATSSIESMVYELKRISAEKSALDKEAKELSRTIKLYMGDAEVLTNEKGKKLASWSRFPRKTVDWARLESDYPDAWNGCVEMKTSDRLTLAVKLEES